MDACYCQHARARHLAPTRGSSRAGLRLRRSLLLVVTCTAQPPKQLQLTRDQHGGSTDSSSSSSRANSPAVAVQEVSTTDVVTAGSFSDFAAAASPMAEQLAGHLVVVSATAPAGSTAGVLTAAGADGGTASPALPEGLPSPVTIDASLSSSFGRCV